MKRWLFPFVVATSVVSAQPVEPYSSEHLAAIARMIQTIPVCRTFRGGVRDGRSGKEARPRSPAAEARAALVEAWLMDDTTCESVFAPAYARHVSQSQAEEIATFAQSDAGRKFFERQYGPPRAETQYTAEDRGAIARYRESPAGRALASTDNSAEWDRDVAAQTRTVIDAKVARAKPMFDELREKQAKFDAKHLGEAQALQARKFEILEAMRSLESIRQARKLLVRAETYRTKIQPELLAHYEDWLATVQRHVEAGAAPRAFIAITEARIRQYQARVEWLLENERRQYVIYRAFLDFAEARIGTYTIDEQGELTFARDEDMETYNDLMEKWNAAIQVEEPAWLTAPVGWARE